MDKQRVLNSLKESKGYSEISDFTINRLIDSGAIKYKKEKEVIQYVRKELHIVWGAFFKRHVKFDEYVDNRSELLNLHTSTAERQAFVKTFYNKIFSKIDCNIRTIGDYGCGLNPLNIPEMNLRKNTNYFAYDIYQGEIKFLNEYISNHFTNINFKAVVKDIFENDNNEYDVTLLIKILPVLEEQNKNCSREILEKINSKYFVVSFPTKSLSGKNVGMDTFYTERFEKLLNEMSLKSEKLVFENEIVYVVNKGK